MQQARQLPASRQAEGGVDVVVAVGHLRRRRFLAAELRSYGHRVREAPTGLEVLRLLERCDEPPLVFADMALSLPSGLHLLSVLRFVGLLGPFVLIVGDDDHDLMPSASTLGAMVVHERVVDLEGLFYIMSRARHRASELSSEMVRAAPKLPERRRYRRLPLEMWIEKRERLALSTAASVTYHRTANLSQGGLSLRQAMPEVTGSRVDLAFRLPGANSPVTVRGRVVGVRPDGREYVVGMQFVDLSPATRRSIAKVVGRPGMGQQAYPA